MTDLKQNALVARLATPAANRGLAGRAIALLRDRRGVAAVEFAFIAPLLIGVYFLALEYSLAVVTSSNVERSASQVGDLITQQQTITRSEVDAIMEIGESVLQPYERSQPVITVTAIEITDDPEPKAKVVWSRKMVAGAGSPDTTPGTETTVPGDLMVPGSFLIRAHTTLDYQPFGSRSTDEGNHFGFGGAFDALNMTMGGRYHLRPRVSTTIPCSDC
ncbi:TadE/TadG family type IV pilus assembly protein [Nitratireductor luteus]|uniref:TadE/TadG family type IV pilus assembly protein n=1 Tax=Nitratireductor luteus TaxID=2976980 RepID=UPI00223F0D90|nr:TadE/TadG family type IV pilus assembly protein [Nitratireductor luteus]